MFGEFMFGESLFAGSGTDNEAANWAETGVEKTVEDDA